MLQGIHARLQRAGGSFAYRNFTYFYVAVVSASMGNQIQRIVDLWLVYELTDSPAFLGLTGLARGIPIVVFSLGGGIIADRLKPRTGNARVYVGLFSVVGTVPTALGLLLTDHLITAYVFNFIVSVFASCWIGAAASTVSV